MLHTKEDIIHMPGFVCILMFQRHYQPQSASDIGTQNGSKQLITNTSLFWCRKCHVHGHLFRDFPLNKPLDQPKAQQEKDAEGFEKVPAKRKILRKTTPHPNPKGP
jgi:hypothetical protein